MADPIVHITGGIPDSGTGNITTLGQTLDDGANLTLGATTDAAVVAGAAGTVNAHLRSISRDLVGGIVLQTGTNSIGAVTQGTASNLNATVVGTGTFAVQAAQSGTWNITNISGTVSLPTGAATAAKQPALGTAGSASLDVISVQGIASMTPLAVTAAQSTASALNATVVGTGTFAVQAAQSGTWNVANTGTFAVQAAQSTASALNATVVGTGTFAVQAAAAGDTASGSTDGGNPVKIGGVGKTANPTAVTDGQRVNGVFDKQGKQITVGAIRQLKGVQQTAIAVNTETTIVTAGASGVFQDLYALTLANSSATAVAVTIKDATSGTTRMILMVPAGETRGFAVPVDSAIPQAAAANNWTATVSSAVSTLEVTALFVSNL